MCVISSIYKGQIAPFPPDVYPFTSIMAGSQELYLPQTASNLLKGSVIHSFLPVSTFNKSSLGHIVTKLELWRQMFKKYSNIKFYKNLSSGSRVVPCKQTDGQTDGRTDRINSDYFHKEFTFMLKNQRALCGT
jgi:hypothetical protein